MKTIARTTTNAPSKNSCQGIAAVLWVGGKLVEVEVTVEFVSIVVSTNVDVRV
jgi:hypothetical protein